MIKTEEVILNDKTFIKTYSDEEVYIRKVDTDEIYSEAFDLPTTNYTYEETEEKIVKETNPEQNKLFGIQLDGNEEKE